MCRVLASLWVQALPQHFPTVLEAHAPKKSKWISNKFSLIYRKIFQGWERAARKLANWGYQISFCLGILALLLLDAWGAQLCMEGWPLLALVWWTTCWKVYELHFGGTIWGSSSKQGFRAMCSSGFCLILDSAYALTLSRRNVFLQQTGLISHTHTWRLRYMSIFLKKNECFGIELGACRRICGPGASSTCLKQWCSCRCLFSAIGSVHAGTRMHKDAQRCSSYNAVYYHPKSYQLVETQTMYDNVTKIIQWRPGPGCIRRILPMWNYAAMPWPAGPIANLFAGDGWRR